MSISQKKQMIAIVPPLSSEKGHFYFYHLGIQEAASVIGWEYQVLIPKKNQLSTLPRGWHQRLDLNGSHLWPRFLKRLHSNHLLKKSLKEFFTEQLDQKKEVIVFFEYFSPRELRLLKDALKPFRHFSISVWLMYRFDPMKSKNKSDKFRRINDEISQHFELKLFTDSSLLVDNLESFYKRKVEILPIFAKTDIPAPSKSEKKFKEILCWWPGHPHKEKGLEHIQKLLTTNSLQGQNIRVLLSSEAELSHLSPTIPFTLLPPTLPRDQFLEYLADADLILLPYKDRYQNTTSGLFVESIVAGKLPVVSSNTWMAEELKRYDLNELITDWEDDHLPERLVSLANEPSIRKKAEKMQKRYRSIHSPVYFSERMLAIANN